MTLRTLDLSLFLEGDDHNRQAFAADLRQELIHHGFVKIVNHGISDQDVDEAFSWNKKFFQLESVTKARIAHLSATDPQRGWSAVGKENAASLYREGFLNTKLTEALKDSREHFDQGSEKDRQYSNRWPDPHAIPGFKEFMQAWYEQLAEVASQLMEALEVAFELPKGSFLNKMTKERNAGEARLLHYPAIDIQELRKGVVSRIWPHFDLGVITLLFQDGVGGLECENRDKIGSFIPVRSVSRSEMIVNVSETLQRWTNDEVPAGLHQVTIPRHLAKLERGLIPDRFSITYFAKADRDASVAPLAQFVRDEKPKYEDITAIQYHQKRLKSAY